MSSSLKNKILYYGGITISAAIIGSSLYYLYKLYTCKDEEEEEIEKILIDEKELFDLDNKLTENGAINLMIKINLLADEYYNKEYSDLDKKRRENINNLEEYTTLCNETFTHKQTIYQLATNEILNKLTHKITIEQIQNFLQTINPKKLEELTLNNEVELLKIEENEDNNLINIKTYKEAFIYYVNIFIEEVKNLQDKYKDINIEENVQIQNMLMFEYLIVKIKADDLLYLKYNTTEQKIKIILYKNNCLDDPDIKEAQNKLEKFEQENQLGNLGN
jgi:hypothetical protein